MPRMAAANWPMTSGFSGLPKLRLSVMASGRAPTAVRLRQASATAWRAAGFGIGGAVAGRAVGGQRQRHRLAVDARPPPRPPPRGASRSGRRWCCRTAPTPRRAKHRSGQAISFSSARARPSRSSIRAAVSAAGLGSRRRRAVIERGLVGQRGERDVRLHPALVVHHDAAAVGDLADHREIQPHLLEDGPGGVLPARGARTISMRSWDSDSIIS